MLIISTMLTTLLVGMDWFNRMNLKRLERKIKLKKKLLFPRLYFNFPLLLTFPSFFSTLFSRFFALITFINILKLWINCHICIHSIFCLFSSKSSLISFHKELGVKILKMKQFEPRNIK